jgi:hypothetical protein
MVITVKGLTVADIFKKTGVTEAQEMLLWKAGITLELTHNSLKFLAPTDTLDDATVGLCALAVLEFKPSSLLELQQGHVDPAFKEALMATIDKLLNQKPAADAGTLGLLEPDPAVFAELDAQIAAQGPTQPAPGQSKPGQPTTSEPAWPVFDLAQLTKAETCKLRDATAMYQPVTGTSKNSRYFLVAANDSLRVAARLQGTSLSVRIEGPNWKANVDKILAAGIDNVHGEKEYASIHVASGDPVLLNKALGAILFGLQVHFDTPFPDLTLIQNKGA